MFHLSLIPKSILIDVISLKLESSMLTPPACWYLRTIALFLLVTHKMGVEVWQGKFGLGVEVNGTGALQQFCFHENGDSYHDFI